jgi:uncharacterized protein (TIGR02145 family)
MKFHLEKNKCFFTMKNVLFALPFIFFSACSSDTDNEDNNTKKGKTFTDSRDGQKYMYVQIGEQVWMAENLNYAVEGGKCYGEGDKVIIGEDEDYNPITKTLSNAEVQANCTKYGRLYDWATAMTLPSNCNSSSCATQIQTKHKGICPSGWHIPSNDDWDTLIYYVDWFAGALKATKGWNSSDSVSNSNGTNDYGFSALPGGYYGSNVGVICIQFEDCRDPSDSHFLNVGYYGDWWSANERERGSYDAYGLYIGYNDYIVGRDDYDKSYLLSVRCIQD